MRIHLHGSNVVYRVAQVCLKRALKVANAAQQQLAVAARVGVTQPVWLFVEILNHYLYYYEQGNPNITAAVLQVRARSVQSGSCSALSRTVLDARCLLRAEPHGACGKRDGK